MIENLEEHVFRLEDSIKDIADFVKEERLRRAEKERQKKRDEAEGVQVQSRHSTARAGCDDSGIKEALLEVAALEHSSINADEVMISEVAAVVEKENLDEGDEEKEEEKNEKVVCEEENKADGSAGVKKEDHDEGGQDEDDKNEKNGCEEENNEGDGEKTEEKNAQEVEKKQHKKEGKSDAPEKEGIAEKDNKNEFPNLDEFLNEVSQEIDKMMVKTENVESLDNY
ncbi:spore wall protein 2-like [Capsicum annuum]|uniref:spore wall protein 2-like n=1 Tax=Capsicum annuum TaxID=4072 RepID=UPI001FB06A15|nr:spore wall protein 2-like [Capsicum annuum]